MNISELEVICLVLSLITLGGIIYLFIVLQKTKKSYQSLIDGVRKGNLEVLLQQHLTHIKANDYKIDHLSEQFRQFVSFSELDLRKVGFKRFNPFHETGGNQSFVLTILDKNNNGIIISTLHQRDITRVYAKEIHDGESEHKLSEEENEILKETVAKK